MAPPNTAQPDDGVDDLQVDIANAIECTELVSSLLELLDDTVAAHGVRRRSADKLAELVHDRGIGRAHRLGRRDLPGGIREGRDANSSASRQKVPDLLAERFLFGGLEAVPLI